LKQWAEWLHQQAAPRAHATELSFWREQLKPGGALISNGTSDLGRDTVGSAERLTITLEADTTQTLLTTVPAVFYASLHEGLLTALVVAVAAWRRRDPARGSGSAVAIELEGHGRSEADGLDLSRTVGWFTTLYPVRLDVDGIDVADACAGGAALGDALKRVKEQLRQIPDGGRGYGLLRYLNGTSGELAQFARPDIAFNYLGRPTAGAADDWAPAPEARTIGSSASSSFPLVHALTINVVTIDDADGPRLVTTWMWSPSRVSAEEVKELAELWTAVLRTLAVHVQRGDAGGRTPSDVPLLTLTQEELDLLEREYRN